MPNGHSRQLAEWACVTTHNSVIEYRSYSTEIGLPLPDNKLKIVCSNWGSLKIKGYSPMNSKLFNPGELASYGATVFLGVLATGQPNTPTVNAIYISSAAFFLVKTILKNQMDIILSFKSDDYLCGLNSHNFKNLVFKQMGHATHFKEVPQTTSFWEGYKSSMTSDFNMNFGIPALDDPYGSDPKFDVNFVEMWGNHIGYTFTNRHFGNAGGSNFFKAKIQGNEYGNNFVPGLNAYTSALESFNPRLQSDNNKWISKGLIHDLIDNSGSNEPTLLIDNVQGFTLNECFKALTESCITTYGFPAGMNTFKQKLLSLPTGTTQTANINLLFSGYGY